MGEVPTTPPPPRGTPPAPQPAPTPPRNQDVATIEAVIREGSLHALVVVLQFFTRNSPEGVSPQKWADLYNQVRGGIARHFGIGRDSVSVSDLPTLRLYLTVFEQGAQLQRELQNLQGEPDEALTQRFRDWFFNWNELSSNNTNLMTAPLQRAIRSDLDAAANDFIYVRDTFRGFGVGLTPPELPPTPGETGLPEGNGGGGGIGPAGGGSSTFETTVTQEPRVPTAEEFLLDFDNAFLRLVGRDITQFTPEELRSLQDRRNELLARYVSRLGEFAERGESPFVRSTRSGEVTSQSTSVQGPGGGSTEVTTFGVETATGGISAGAFLVPKVTPVAFLSELFPSADALKSFAEGPNIAESPLPSSGFAGATEFQARQ